MKFCARITGWILLLAILSMGTGCRYLTNRYFDARDTFAIGAGVTAENPVTGWVPPSLGLYFEATDWLHLGAIHFNGYTAECDLRGTFVGPECETRYGLLWWQMIQKNQDYKNACYANKFKIAEFPWCDRLESIDMRYDGKPAKRLHYEHYQSYMIRGTSLMHRGWHYWEYVGFQGAICEPFLSHAGIMVKAGFDLSEVTDFLLGWVGVDFKRDDMTHDEFLSYLDYPTWWGIKLMPAKPRQPLPAAGAPAKPAPAPVAPPASPAK